LGLMVVRFEGENVRIRAGRLRLSSPAMGHGARGGAP
jgi:hypothetical protein